MPPQFTLWAEGNDDIGPDMLATSDDLGRAIERAVHYSRTLSTLVLILETDTGAGLAVTSACRATPGAAGM